MTRIIGGGGKYPSQTVGRPGYRSLVAFTGASRKRVGLVTHAAQKGVTRLLARNPAKYQGDAPFGDVLARPSYTTAMTGTNNDLVFKSVSYGDPATDVRVQLVVSGSNTALSATASGQDVTVNVGTGLGEITMITVAATGGTWTITYGAQTTSALNWNATAAQVQAALWLLSSINDNDCIVTGGPGDEGGTSPYIITWIGSLGNITAPTTTATSLTGGPHTATVVTVREGSATAAASTAQQVMDIINSTAATKAVVEAALAPGNDGTGIVTALAYVTLAGGTVPVIQGSKGAANPEVIKRPVDQATNLAAARGVGSKKVINRGTNRSLRKY